MAQKVKNQTAEIEKQVAELGSQNGSVQKLSEKLQTTQSKLLITQEREKELSDLLAKSNVAKTELESYAESLKTKLAADDDVSKSLYSKLCLEAATSRLNGQLEAALCKLKNSESKEIEMVEKMKSQSDEIKRLAEKLEAEQIANSGEKKNDARETEMVERIKNQNSELERLNSELETERSTVHKLRNQLDATLLKLEVVESREKIISGMMEKTVQAKNELEVSVQDFKSVMQKDIAEKYDAEMKKLKFCIESTTAKLKSLEKKYVDVQHELSECQSKLKSSEESWTRKLEHENQKQAEMQLMINGQNREYTEAKVQAKRISEQLESTLRKLENSEKEIQIRVAEVEEVHSRIKLLETELEEAKEKARKSGKELEMCHQKDKKTRKELKTSRNELETIQKELALVADECRSLRKDKAESEEQRNSVGVNSSSTNAQIIVALERESARLQEEVQKSELLNQELQAKLKKYEAETKALNLNPATDTVYNHPLTSDDEQVPNKSPSKMLKSEPRRANDLLGEMKELKKEVVRNNHSSARLCRELQQHGHLYSGSRQHQPASSSSPHQRSPPLKNTATDGSSSSDSANAAKRKQILDGINCDTSSGTGSAETLTLLTASSETSFSSNPITSNEDLRTANGGRPFHSRTKEAFISASFTDVANRESHPGNQFRRASASEERWTRRSVSPISSRTSSESSLLHLKVLRQLGEEPDQKRTSDSVPDQDRTENGDRNPFFQYEGPLVLMLTPGSAGDGSSVDEEGKECALQRSNYSSPDLGIESDPNLVSSRSSSTSSSESRPQVKGRNGTGSTDKAAHRILVPCQAGSLTRQSLDREDISPKRNGLEPMRATRIFDSSEGNTTPADNPGMMLHGLCPLKDLELLRQEVEEALVTLQGTKATVRNRLDSKKISSPAKSLEYSTLKEVDSRCLQLGEYLLRCRALLDSFRTLPVATAQSWPSLQQVCLSSSSTKNSQRLQVLDSNELSLTASTETVCYKGDVQRGTDDSEALREQVLNLQNKLQALEKQYKKTVEQLKATENRTKMVNRALEKQLSATTKVIKMAKGNLKQSGTIEVVVYKESETTENKCS